MPKVKVPNRLKELADELNLSLGDDADESDRLSDIIGWMKEQNQDQRNEESEYRDDVDRELDEIEAELLEGACEPKRFYSPVPLPEPFELVTYLRRLGRSDECIAALMFWAEGRDPAAVRSLTPSELRIWYAEEATARAIAGLHTAVGKEPTQSTVIS